MAPVIVSYSEKFMNVWEIPFGAVTVCPVGGPTPLDYNITDTDKPRITRARYRKNNSSTELFTEVATEEGFCYTFNMLNFNDVFTEKVWVHEILGYWWNKRLYLTFSVFEAFDRLRDNSTVPLTSWELQEGYLTKRPYPYPHRASSSGENGGLKFDIWRKISEVKRSSSHNKGFKLFLHLPCELPQFDKRYYRFPLGKSATIIVSPMMTVTESLKSYDTETRQCYFKKEKELRLFKTYTRPNCQIECLVNYALKICNCVPFSLPRLEGNKTCDSNRSEKCFLEAKSAMIRDNMEISLNTSVLSDDRGKLGTCDCLPACTSLQYDVEISYDDIRSFGPYANIKWVSNYSTSSNNQFPFCRAIRSAVSIFFKDDDFIFTKRSEMFNSAYVIGSFGGLLGLFMGVSIISLFEIIYFIAFRKQDDT